MRIGTGLFAFETGLETFISNVNTGDSRDSCAAVNFFLYLFFPTGDKRAMKLILSLIFSIALAAQSQQIKPSQIISLYSINGGSFLLKNTRTGIDYGSEWTVPKGEVLMLTDLTVNLYAAASANASSGPYTAHIGLFPSTSTNRIVAVFFTVGLEESTTERFSTPIPVGYGVSLANDLTGTSEVVLRGYLTPND